MGSERTSHAESGVSERFCCDAADDDEEDGGGGGGRECGAGTETVGGAVTEGEDEIVSFLLKLR